MSLKETISTVIHAFAIPLIAEGLAMLSCMVPSVHFHDQTWQCMLISGLLTCGAGALCRWGVRPNGTHKSDRRTSYLLVVLMWLVLVLFGTLPFLTTGVTQCFTDAFFESMSGLTTTGATIFTQIESLPASILFWRSIMQWVGGFGIVLLILAVVPKMGINKYSLYTAEASGADNSGKTSVTLSATVRHTLMVYILLTVLFIVLLLLSGMEWWDAVNLTFTNVSSGGFSIHDDGIASVTHSQQYILTLAMFVSAINFTFLYNVLTLRLRTIRSKLDQFALYFGITLVAVVVAVVVLRYQMQLPWHQALRQGVVQTVSVISTTGSVVADTRLWWAPLLFLFLILSLCGGMAGSTAGGLKMMRVIILVRNVRNILRNRLHPSVVNPVRLNGYPVAPAMVNNVMVIFFVYAVTLLVGFVMLAVFRTDVTEALGAAAACLSGYGPGLGSCGGFGSYHHFTEAAKWTCSLLMLLGRLECITVFVLFFPGFWKQR